MCRSALTDKQSSKTRGKNGGSNVDDVGIFCPLDLQVSTGSDGNVTIGHMLAILFILEIIQHQHEQISRSVCGRLCAFS